MKNLAWREKSSRFMYFDSIRHPHFKRSWRYTNWVQNAVCRPNVSLQRGPRLWSTNEKHFSAVQINKSPLRSKSFTSTPKSLIYNLKVWVNTWTLRYQHFSWVTPLNTCLRGSELCCYNNYFQITLLRIIRYGIQRCKSPGGKADQSIMNHVKSDPLSLDALFVGFPLNTLFMFSKLMKRS